MLHDMCTQKVHCPQNSSMESVREILNIPGKVHLCGSITFSNLKCSGSNLLGLKSWLCLTFPLQ